MTGFSALPLAQEQGSDDNDIQKFKGISRILGPRWTHLPSLTIGLLGVQIFWSVEMSYASPYLLSLGMSKSKMAIVFIAGPLSGLIMQPLIGSLADNSTSRFGRRRPYMLIGTILCIIAMLLLGYTRSVAAVFTGSNNTSNDILTIWLAVLSIYLIDFSINAVMAVDRALLVDTLPWTAQASGNAWAARMLGLGSVVGFFFGNVDLPYYLPFLGNSQLKVLSVVGSILLLSGHLVMVTLVKERVLVKPKGPGKTFRSEMREIWSSIRNLPRTIRQICIIQFFAWLAWFPLLFYTTLYVGDLHKRSSPMPATDEERAALDAEATRFGSRALFYSAIFSLAANITLPAFILEASAKPAPKIGDQHRNVVERGLARVLRIPKSMQIHLASLWAASHLIFAGCMMATFFTYTVSGATLLISITGFSWAITQWAPFSLLAEAILTGSSASTHANAETIRLSDTRTRLRTSEDSERDVFLIAESDSEDGNNRPTLQEGRSIFTNSEAQTSRINVHHQGEHGEYGEAAGDGAGLDRPGGLSAKAGIILGIHNIFIVVPQFLITGFSSIIFAIFDPEKSGLPPHHSSATGHGTVANDTVPNVNIRMGDLAGHATAMLRSTMTNEEQTENTLGRDQSNSVIYIFRFGGVAAAIAFVLCWRLARELRHT